jgi:hypothetical protein
MATAAVRRLVVGGGRAPGFPKLGPDDVSLNLKNSGAKSDIIGDINNAAVNRANPDLANGSFGAVHFENVPWSAQGPFGANVKLALGEAHRLLKPGGQLTVEAGRLPETFVETLKALGFKNIKIESVSADKTIVSATRAVE